MNKRTAAAEAETRRFKIFGVEFVYLYLFGIALAFVGFVAENAARLVGFGILDSRFHILPFISPYALIVFALHLLVLDPDDLTFFGRRVFEKRCRKTEIYSNLICYLVICAFVFLGELAVGNLWDSLFGVELWNYSSLPLSVTQYAGLIPTLGYGTGAYLILKFVYKPTLAFIRRRVSFRTAKIICLTLGVLIVLDTVRLILMIALFGEAPMYWMIKLW